MSVALATTGPVGRPVGDPPTGSNEMAKVVPGCIGAGERASASTRVAGGVEQPERLRRIGADDRPQLRALARRDGHRPGHRQAPGGAVVSGDERSLDALDHERGDHRRGSGDRHRRRGDRVGTHHQQPEHACRGERRGQREGPPIARPDDAAGTVEPGDDALAQVGRGRDAGEAREQDGEMLAPSIDVAREGGLGEHAAQRGGALVALEQPERELGGGDVGVWPGGVVGGVSHRPGNP